MQRPRHAFRGSRRCNHRLARHRSSANSNRQFAPAILVALRLRLESSVELFQRQLEIVTDARLCSERFARLPRELGGPGSLPGTQGTQPGHAPSVSKRWVIRVLQALPDLEHSLEALESRDAIAHGAENFSAHLRVVEPRQRRSVIRLGRKKLECAPCIAALHLTAASVLWIQREYPDEPTPPPCSSLTAGAEASRASASSNFLCITRLKAAHR